MTISKPESLFAVKQYCCLNTGSNTRTFSGSFEKFMVIKDLHGARRQCSDVYKMLMSPALLETSSFFATVHLMLPQSLVVRVVVLAEVVVTVSSKYFSMDLRLAFMKKLTTVETFRPNCSAIVAWISLLGLLISLKMATRVLLWISVNTILGFFPVNPGGVDSPAST